MNFAIQYPKSSLSRYSVFSPCTLRPESTNTYFLHLTSFDLTFSIDSIPTYKSFYRHSLTHPLANQTKSDFRRYYPSTLTRPVGDITKHRHFLLPDHHAMMLLHRSLPSAYVQTMNLVFLNFHSTFILQKEFRTLESILIRRVSITPTPSYSSSSYRIHTNYSFQTHGYPSLKYFEKVIL